MTDKIAPDDTPTRLQRLLAFIQEHQHGGCHILSKGDACTCPLCDLDELRAEVSRLREEMAPLYNTEQWLKWCDIRVLERAEAAEAEVSRLQQELRVAKTDNMILWEKNQLLERSLAMLVTLEKVQDDE